MSLWEDISATIVGEIEKGTFAEGERLPPSGRLADKYGVHQHTVLKAIAHLESEGVLRVEQGRGTFVAERPVQFRLGSQTWFEQNVIESSYTPGRTVVSVSGEAASKEVSEGLGVVIGEPVVTVILVGEANNTPIYVGTYYLSDRRMPDIADVFRELEKRKATDVVFTKLFAPFGIQEINRKQVKIQSRLPKQLEVQRLRMHKSTPILETAITLVDRYDVPLAYVLSAYCSDRVVLTITM